ncbi:hypothetical protein BG015_003416 [Linnemannia schmuckeri]|uniref:Uncharacterized protein n=1 Tax=Linnemannia schmuckeri TaxID=64567 RepID=A0A9P5S615_9FUNG|nr:hypothetical protein BG015_003416 [Linnemannia schmuckeri]
MCHRVICHDCGKFTWEGCGLHIAQALAGLSLEQICSCDDDRDSEHSWTTITTPATSTSFSTVQAPRGGGATRYPLPYSGASAAATSVASLSSLRSTGAALETCHNDDDDGSSIIDNSTTVAYGTTTTRCSDTPAAVEYKLSKISATSATEAAIRMAKQAAALEELKRRKEEKDRELKEHNQGALDKLLQGLEEAVDDGDKKEGGDSA